MFWACLARHQHSEAGPANATMVSLLDELNLLPAKERERSLTHGVGIAVLIASRGTWADGRLQLGKGTRMVWPDMSCLTLIRQ